MDPLMTEIDPSTLDFTIMYESILDLFKAKSVDGCYDCAIVQSGNQLNLINNHCAYENLIGGGDMRTFHDLLENELHEFFENIVVFFGKNDERTQKRRMMEYDRLITRKLCKRAPFRRNLMIFLDGELASCYNSVERAFLEKYQDVTTRQKMIAASIKNYIYRTFYIYEYCSDRYGLGNTLN